MLNLLTIKIQSLNAHLARLKDTEEAVAELMAGEVLAGRSPMPMADACTMIQKARMTLESRAFLIRASAEGEGK